MVSVEPVRTADVRINQPQSRIDPTQRQAVTVTFYSQEIHGPFETHDIGDFDLEQGGKIRNLQLAYATFGKLSARKDNAILFPTWYSGSSKVLELVYLGSGRALDPEKYFIILVNQIGNGLSSSPDNTRPPFNAARFPAVRIGDDVRAQHKFITEKFGIEKLALVLGISMGAQQTYEWAIRYPDAVARAAPIAGTAKGTAHNRMLVESWIETIQGDPAWNGGWYKDAQDVHRGLRRHARLFVLSGLTPAFFNQGIWKKVGFSSVDDFLAGFAENHFLAQDPNDLILLLTKWKDYDASRTAGGDLTRALARIKAKTFVVAIEEDGFFPLADIAAEQKLVPHSALKLVSSSWGHSALFGFDPAYIELIDAYLNELLGSN
jgi:homoserine O-acetyltransferase